MKDVEYIKGKIRAIPDWPKKGIMFRDVTTLFKDADGFKKVMDSFYERYKDEKIDLVAGIESRGFITGAALADRLGVGFVPLRKKGKLPAEIISEKYELEYGSASIEVHKDAVLKGQNVLIADDLLATGGTMLAATKLVERLGGNVFECCFIVDLPDLKGREKLEEKGYSVFSIVYFDGE